MKKKEKNPNPYLTPYQKLMWDESQISCKNRNYEAFKRKCREHLCDLGASNDFLEWRNKVVAIIGKKESQKLKTSL